MESIAGSKSWRKKKLTSYLEYDETRSFGIWNLSYLEARRSTASVYLKNIGTHFSIFSKQLLLFFLFVNLSNIKFFNEYKFWLESREGNKLVMSKFYISCRESQIFGFETYLVTSSIDDILFDLLFINQTQEILI